MAGETADANRLGIAPISLAGLDFHRQTVLTLKMPEDGWRLADMLRRNKDVRIEPWTAKASLGDAAADAKREEKRETSLRVIVSGDSDDAIRLNAGKAWVVRATRKCSAPGFQKNCSDRFMLCDSA